MPSNLSRIYWQVTQSSYEVPFIIRPGEMKTLKTDYVHDEEQSHFLGSSTHNPSNYNRIQQQINGTSCMSLPSLVIHLNCDGFPLAAFPVHQMLRFTNPQCLQSFKFEALRVGSEIQRSICPQLLLQLRKPGARVQVKTLLWFVTRAVWLSRRLSFFLSTLIFQHTTLDARSTSPAERSTRPK